MAAGLSADWWWFDPARRNDFTSAARAWEILRRVPAYCALYQLAREEVDKSTVPLHYMAFRQRFTDLMGVPLATVILEGLNPDKTWLQLSDRQREVMAGNMDALPRQTLPDADPANPMALGVVTLLRGLGGAPLLGPIGPLNPLDASSWAAGDGQFLVGHPSGIEDALATPPLPLPEPQAFVTVSFDARLSPDALRRQLDAELSSVTPPPLWEEALMRASAAASRYAHGPDPLVRVVADPRGDFRAIALVPAYYPPKAKTAGDSDLPTRFASAVRNQNRNKWQNPFLAVWNAERARFGGPPLKWPKGERSPKTVTRANEEAGFALAANDAKSVKQGDALALGYPYDHAAHRSKAGKLKSLRNLGAAMTGLIDGADGDLGEKVKVFAAARMAIGSIQVTKLV